MGFKATLGTGESKMFHTKEEAEKWFRDHYVKPQGETKGKHTHFTQEVTLQDGSKRTDKIGSIEEV